MSSRNDDSSNLSWEKMIDNCQGDPSNIDLSESDLGSDSKNIDEVIIADKDIKIWEQWKELKALKGDKDDEEPLDRDKDLEVDTEKEKQNAVEEEKEKEMVNGVVESHTSEDNPKGVPSNQDTI
ncbi:hypothetical protein LWI29_015561 [Acer saccharum]|uniref:Uncharacterized protein n=1 Tax=Acer saccharum TaxID=4024 RepID=A0AA39RU58_ACESA|nr:hypothetical protein LWI29_015561 [Acer saccharum]